MSKIVIFREVREDEEPLPSDVVFIEDEVVERYVHDMVPSDMRSGTDGKIWMRRVPGIETSQPVTTNAGYWRETARIETRPAEKAFCFEQEANHAGNAYWAGEGYRNRLLEACRLVLEHWHSDHPTDISILQGIRKVVEDASKSEVFKLFQDKVNAWQAACFGGHDMDPIRRMSRFMEEVLEYAQSVDFTREFVEILVDRVYSRPKGDPKEEAGDVAVTLAAMCTATHVRLDVAQAAALDKLWEKIDIIREKQRTKQFGSPLPGKVEDDPRTN
jgi:NTP pyrophosphatase (non-canonical NTP hydrolase)